MHIQNSSSAAAEPAPDKLPELALRRQLTTHITPGVSLFLWGQAVTVLALEGFEATVRFHDSGLPIQVAATQLSSQVERPPSDQAEVSLDVTDAQWQRAKAIKDVVVVIIHSNVTSRDALDQLGAPIALGHRQLQRLRARYDGTTASLLDKRPGRKKGSVVIAPVALLIISEVFQAVMKKPEQTSFNEICRMIAKRCPADVVMPQRSTIARLARNQNLQLGKRRQLGPSVIAEHAARFARSHHVGQALAEVQIDHTPVDMIVLDETRRYVLGRPWLTLVMDVASRAILGFWLSFDAPSMVSVARALAMSAVPKHAFLSALGLGDLPWNVWGLGQRYLTDRAAEFRCADFQRGCRFYDIEHELRPLGKKHFGGHIERLIGRLMGRFHLLPGTTFSNTKLRRLYNSEQRAIFNARDVVKLLVTDIVDYMHTGHSSIRLTPAQAFLEFLPRDGGQPLLPPIIEDPAAFALEWMPRVSVKNRHDGVHWRNHRYFHDALREIPLGQKVTLIPDHATSEVIARIRDKRVRLERQTPATFVDISFETAYNAAKAERALEPEMLETRHRALELRDSVVDNAAIETKAAKKKAFPQKPDTPEAEIERFDGAGLLRPPTIYEVD